MPKTMYKLDLSKPMEEQAHPGHNRWHPDIPAAFSVDPGTSFRMECKDWTDGQIKNNDNPHDIRDVNLERVHVLSGPVYINGAEPGDLLVVDILDIGTFQEYEWGFNGIFAKENGGNCDIKNLSKGSRIYFPVFVDGAKLSVGDLHFSQGDGEITFCGGIEMPGWIDLKVDVIKGGMEKNKIKTNPAFKPGPVDPLYTDFIVFEGVSVSEIDGKQHYLDANLAYRRACLNAIEYLKALGYTGEQAYMILGTAPVEGRIAGIVDIPNACCTIAIPTQIFDKNILPR